MKDQNLKEYTDLEKIRKEVEDSKKLFKKNNWPIIDVTRRSVEETAASILKIIEIKKINENNFSLSKRSKKKNFR